MSSEIPGIYDTFGVEVTPATEHAAVLTTVEASLDPDDLRMLLEMLGLD